MKPANRIILAPMEGVMDAQMRHIIANYGHISYCVTEFIRVVDHLLPQHVFYKNCPEILQEDQTGKIPVRVQLLGQHSFVMAENAQRAVELGSFGVDLNFGCPSKTVNRSKGGAVLLQDPEIIYKIVRAVREAVTLDSPVSAKMRLGYHDSCLAIENAKAIEEAGATEIVIHGRTKKQAYQGKADWHKIAEIKKHLRIAVIANGDIVSAESADHCMNITKCRDIMIGRGCLAMPNLAAVIMGEKPLQWVDILMLLYNYGNMFHLQDKSIYYVRRIKQWLRYLMTGYVQAANLFNEIKIIESKDDMRMIIYKKLKESEDVNCTY